MAKILIIASSARVNGNSDLLAAQFLKGASEAGHQTELVHLRDYHYGFCSGCQACSKSGVCVQKDDMGILLQKMMDADTIVLSSPVYFYCVNGQMKTFLDRCVPLYGRMANKPFYLMATAEDSNPQHIDKVFEAFEGFTCCFDGCSPLGRIYGSGADAKGEIKGTPAYEEAYNLGKNVK
jgi:multimeric flavodoxin WrbA